MLKIFIISISFVLSIFNLCFAQSINNPNIPSDGMTLYFDKVDNVVEFQMDAPWDFSSTFSNSNYSMTFLPINLTSFQNEYPNASHVLSSENGDFFLGYDNNGFYAHGRITSSTSTNYSSELLLTPFPFDASLYHEDSITSSVTWNGFNAPFKDKVEISGISSGTVTMPNGNSYENAVLVSAKRTSTTGPDPLFGQTMIVEEVSHQWWLDGYPYPVVEILNAYSNSSLVLSRSLFLMENTTSVSENINEHKRKLIKITDVLGRECILPQKGKINLFIFDNGDVEKKFIP